MPKQTKICQIAWLWRPAKSKRPGYIFSGKRFASKGKRIKVQSRGRVWCSTQFQVHNNLQIATPKRYMATLYHTGFKNSQVLLGPFKKVMWTTGTAELKAINKNTPIRTGRKGLVSQNGNMGMTIPVEPTNAVNIMYRNFATGRQ